MGTSVYSSDDVKEKIEKLFSSSSSSALCCYPISTPTLVLLLLLFIILSLSRSVQPVNCTQQRTGTTTNGLLRLMATANNLLLHREQHSTRPDSTLFSFSFSLCQLIDPRDEYCS